MNHSRLQLTLKLNEFLSKLAHLTVFVINELVLVKCLKVCFHFDCTFHNDFVKLVFCAFVV